MTEHGKLYARELATHIQKRLWQMKQENDQGGEDYRGNELVVMLGTQAIHHATVEHLKKTAGPEVTFMSNSVLNELRGGELDKMTHADIKHKFPEIWEQRMKDKLHFRYPGAGGESYIDLIQRIKPVIIELERQRKSVLIVSHLAVQRCLCAYFSGLPSE
jgi:broad specificity phosphatase PhoE